MDDLITYLKNYIEEPLKSVCLLQADGTAIFITDRDLQVLKYFGDLKHWNSINSKVNNIKCDIPLDCGTLEYESTVVYLGVAINDTRR